MGFSSGVQESHELLMQDRQRAEIFRFVFP